MPAPTTRKNQADNGIGKADVKDEDGQDMSAKLSSHDLEQRAPPRIRPWHLYRFATDIELLATAAGLSISLVFGSGMPSFAVIFADAADQAFTPSEDSSLDSMGQPIQDLVMLMFLMLFGAWAWQTCLRWSAERQAARMRIAYLKCLLSQDTSWFDVNDPASLTSKMAMDVACISECIGYRSGMIAMVIGQVVFGFLISLAYHWEMTLVLMSTVPMFIAVGVYMSKALTASQSPTQNHFAQANAVAEESIMAIRTVIAFGGERHEMQRFGAHLNRAKRGSVIQGCHLGAAMGSFIAILCVMLGIGFGYGAYRLVAEGVRPSKFVTVLIAAFIAVMALQQLGDDLLSWSQGMQSAAGMFQLLEAVPTIEKIAEATQPKAECSFGTIEKIQFKDVRFSYPSRTDIQVLKGISLTIHKGQRVAFVGESGSGKSTMIQMIERFYDPALGEIYVNGVDMRFLPVLSWRRLIGYVGQEPVLFTSTILDNIKGGDDAITEERAVEALKQAQVFEFLNKLPKKLKTFVGNAGGQMSGGQKQRIAIARALVKRPQILLLDEATSALDNASEKMVQETIEQLQDSTATGHHLTTIAVAHRLSTIRNSNVIFVLKSGVVHEMGSHQELMDIQGDYFGLVQSQDSGDTLRDSPVRIVSQNSQNSVDSDDCIRKASSFQHGVVSQVLDSVHASVARVTRVTTRKTTRVTRDIEQALLKEMEDAGFKSPTGRLFGMMKPHMVILVMAFSSAVLTGTNMPVLGYTFAACIDTLYLPRQPNGSVGEMKSDMNMWLAVYAALTFLCFAGEFGKNGGFYYIQACVTQKLREQAYGSLVRQEIGFFDNPRNSPAGMTALLAERTNDVSKTTGVGVGNVLSALVSLVGGLALAFFASWRLALVILGVMPVVLGANVVVMKMTMPGQNNDGDEYAAAFQLAQEAVVNIRTVRALVAEAYLTEMFSARVLKTARKVANRDSWKAAFAFAFGNSVGMFLIYIVAFWYGSYLIDNGTSPKDVFQALFCILMGVMGAGLAVAVMPGALQGQLAAYETFRVIDRKSQIDAVSPEGTHCDFGDGKITFQNVTFRYPHRPELWILNGLTLTIASGQFVGFVGPSGCGKSTIVSMLQRYYDPTSGDITVGGVNLREFNVAWWRSQIGFVGQEPILFDISLEDNVKYGKRDATREEVEKAGRTANMDYVFNGKTKWEDRVGTRGGKLSGGQKQRCAIARALIRNPKMLILDEATSALDSVSEQVVQAALDAAKVGRTTISIAHRLSTLNDCDMIFVMKAGKVSDTGTLAELQGTKVSEIITSSQLLPPMEQTSV